MDAAGCARLTQRPREVSDCRTARIGQGIPPAILSAGSRTQAAGNRFSPHLSGQPARVSATPLTAKRHRLGVVVGALAAWASNNGAESEPFARRWRVWPRLRVVYHARRVPAARRAARGDGWWELRSTPSSATGGPPFLPLLPARRYTVCSEKSVLAEYFVHVIGLTGGIASVNPL